MTSLKNTNDTEHTVEEIELNQNLRFNRDSEIAAKTQAGRRMNFGTVICPEGT